MDRELVRFYRDRWKAVEEIEAEEERNASIDLRLLQMNSILQLAVGLGMPVVPDETKYIVCERWARLKEIWLSHALQRT